MNPAPVPEVTPPALMCLSPLGKRNVLGRGDQSLHRLQPRFDGCGMPGQHVDIKAVFGGSGRLQPGIVQPFWPGGTDLGAKGAVQKRVLAGEIADSLNPGMLRRSLGFDVVVIPADAVSQPRDKRIRLDDNRTHRSGTVKTCRDIRCRDAGQGIRIGPPQLDRSRGRCRPRPVGGNMDDGMIRIHPEAQAGSVAVLRHQRGIHQRQFLAKRLHDRCRG